MEQKKKLIFSVSILVVVLVLASVLYNHFGDKITSNHLIGESSQEEETEKKKFPPDFTVLDASGNTVKLSDFRGKPVVVNFWASWCGPCKSEMPAFDAIYQEMGDEIHFLMVNMTDGGQETLASAQNFITNSGYSFPVYYDTQSSAAIAYGVSSLPTTYFFDAEGYGVAYAIGAIDEDALQRGIAMITE